MCAVMRPSIFRVLFLSIVILQYSQRRPDHVVKLTAVGHAEKNPNCDEHDHNAEWDEEIEGFHRIILWCWM